MNKQRIFRNVLSLPLAIGLLVAFGTYISRAADAEPPAGFTAIFNGKDLSGWWGFNADPRKYWSLSEDERARKRQASLQDLSKHWTVENGELVNDGNGDYGTTEKDYGDIEVVIDYKKVPKADRGIYLRATP